MKQALASLPVKPGYSLTRKAFWVSFYFAWAVVALIVVGALAGSREAVDLAPVALPSMVALIAAMLGIHRWTGAMDYKASIEVAQEAAEGREQ